MNQLALIYATLVAHPGLTILGVHKKVGRFLGLSRAQVEGRLASMEASPFSVYEDDESRLYPHSRYGQLSACFSEEVGRLGC